MIFGDVDTETLRSSFNANDDLPEKWETDGDRLEGTEAGPSFILGGASIPCINIYYYNIVFPLNGIFDPDLVHLYLSDSVQMSIKYHDNAKIRSLTDIRGPQNITRHPTPPGG